jgi:hypothetical protein
VPVTPAHINPVKERRIVDEKHWDRVSSTGADIQLKDGRKKFALKVTSDQANKAEAHQKHSLA